MTLRRSSCSSRVAERNGEERVRCVQSTEQEVPRSTSHSLGGQVVHGRTGSAEILATGESRPLSQWHRLQRMLPLHKEYCALQALPARSSPVQASCSIAVIVLFTWSKDPSSAFSFDNLVFQDARGSLDFRPHWYFFASVGLFTSAYALLLPAVGFVGLNVWPLAVSH